MCRGSIIDECRRGAAYGCQIADFACVIHPHFHHGITVMLAQLEQGKRQADVVIQVTLCCEYRTGISGMCMKNAGQHFLDRGLAITAGDRYQRNSEFTPPISSKIAQA